MLPLSVPAIVHSFARMASPFNRRCDGCEKRKSLRQIKSLAGGSGGADHFRLGTHAHPESHRKMRFAQFGRQGTQNELPGRVGQDQGYRGSPWETPSGKKPGWQRGRGVDPDTLCLHPDGTLPGTLPYHRQ
ncbi:hypothetical protein DESC_740101 [Desulfosarcina cetonica]|nr:hypothetical protein DESC_740101 [Desulfosarcina cetonica]